MRLSKIAMMMATVLFFVGCQPFNLPSFDVSSIDLLSKDKDDDTDSDDDEFETKVKTPFIGDYSAATGRHLIALHGVGLVTGLDGTGGDPHPSGYRSALLEEMRKRNVKNPNAILASPTTALVLVKAYVPPLVKKGDRYDVHVYLPPGIEAASLKGGWLMETRLSEKAIVPGRGALKGHEYAKAKGPILISTNDEEDKSQIGRVRRGRILGGALSLKERDMQLWLRNEFRNTRNSERIARRIGSRFHEYNKHGSKEPLAIAKDDQLINLKIHSKYKDNQPRYLEVIRNISFRETERARYVRMQKLKRQLNNPATCEKAAIKLEALGAISIPTLKDALKNPLLEVQFQSALALAYLGDPSGLDVLAKAAREEPAFRVFAFAAMAIVEDAQSNILLRELMNSDSAETRYGAFRALSTLDANDPFIRGKKFNDEFMFHVVATEGKPLIHLTTWRKSEIVLFGAHQQFKTPMTVRAGNYILLTAPAGSDTITVSRFEVGKEDQKKIVSTKVADVVTALVDVGASYPDIAQMLIQAQRQHNTPGHIEIDALPSAGRFYYRPGTGETDSTKSETRIGSPLMIPNLFDIGKNRQKSTTSTKPKKPESKKVDNEIAKANDAKEKPDNSSKVVSSKIVEPTSENEPRFFRPFKKQREPELE